MHHLLDNPAWHALTGPHRSLAVGDDRARRYRDDVSPFAAVAEPGDPAAYAHLGEVVGAGATVGVFAEEPPAGWRTLAAYDAVQYVYERSEAPVLPRLGGEDGRAGASEDGGARLVTLGDADVPDALELVERTRPGPFLERTIEFGGYHGVRVGDRLAAMAGQRMRPEGWCEVSAVCADPEFRGRGYAAQAMAAVIAGILARGERPFLHVEAANDRAVAVYEGLGFRARRAVSILVCRAA
jgi:ribosomal protein S18 acetylase RimI-like enzyme